jgi:hypothetical protein
LLEESSPLIHWKKLHFCFKKLHLYSMDKLPLWFKKAHLYIFVGKRFIFVWQNVTPLGTNKH